MNHSKNRRQFIRSAAMAGLGAGLTHTSIASIFKNRSPNLANARVGMIGLDTSHCEAFTKVLNDPNASPEFAGFPVVAAYPYGSRDIASSANRIPKITEDIKKYGVEIVNSIEDVIKKSDVILLET